MKTITFVSAQWCGYCAYAEMYIGELLVEEPSFVQVPLVLVDEDHKEGTGIAYCHEYVPAFYLDGEHAFDGVPNKTIIREIFQEALAG